MHNFITIPEISYAEIVSSSTQLHKLHFSMKNITSFKKILKSKGPNIDPCGTPKRVIFHSLKKFWSFTLFATTKIAAYEIQRDFIHSICMTFCNVKTMIN